MVAHLDGTRTFSGGVDGTVREWDLSTGAGRILHTFDYEVFSVTATPDGSRLVANDATGGIVVLDADSGDVVLSPERTSGRSDSSSPPTAASWPEPARARSSTSGTW